MCDDEVVRTGLSSRRATATMRSADMVERVGRGRPHAYGTHGSSGTPLEPHAGTCGVAKVRWRRPSSHCEASIPRAPATAPM